MSKKNSTLDRQIVTVELDGYLYGIENKLFDSHLKLMNKMSVLVCVNGKYNVVAKSKKVLQHEKSNLKIREI